MREIELAENRTRILVHKRVPGYLTKLACPLPALVTMEKGQVLRYPSLAGRHRAARLEIPCMGLDTIGLREENVGASGSITRLARFTPPKPDEKERHGLDGGKDDGRGTPSEDHGRRCSGEEGQQVSGNGLSDEPSAKKAAEHILKEKMITF